MSKQEHHTGPRIVVGVDGSPSSMSALRWAIRQAGLTGATVDVVIAWHYPVAVAATDGADGMEEVSTSRKTRRRPSPTRSAAPVDPGSNVRLRARVVEGNPAQVLLDACDGADLLVVEPRIRRIHRSAARLGRPALRASRALPRCRDPRPGTWLTRRGQRP